MKAIGAVGALLVYLVALAWMMPTVALDALAVGVLLVAMVGAILAFGERVQA